MEVPDIIQEKSGGTMKVVMIGADRSVKGGVSAVVNNLYAAGLEEQIDLKYIGTMVDGSKLRKALQAAIALVKFVLAMPGCDIVHVNLAADASCLRKMLFMKVAGFFHKKILIHSHGGDFQGFYYERCSEKKRQKVKAALNRADLFLVLSEEWKTFFSQIVEPSKIHVLQNAIPIPAQAKNDYSSHKAVFLGRLCKEKGIGELLEAMPRIRQEISDFELILGGFWEAGNEQLERKADALKDVVGCPGWVSPKEREQLFQECSIFVLPTWFEGQPVSLLEAMAAGMCVAASAVGGIPQILGAGELGGSEDALPCSTGMLLPAKNPQALADALISLLKDEALRKQMGQQARARIQKEYDIQNYIGKLLAYYRKLAH